MFLPVQPGTYPAVSVDKIGILISDQDDGCSIIIVPLSGSLLVDIIQEDLPQTKLKNTFTVVNEAQIADGILDITLILILKMKYYKVNRKYSQAISHGAQDKIMKRLR